MSGDSHGNVHEEIYHTGLKNLHALEQSAIELTERQVERLEHYPEMKARLELHRRESEQQAKRLEAIMDRHGIGPSAAKNAFTSVMGNVAAALHAPAGDEILKNTFANFAFEHQEIASYTSLIAMAEAQGDAAAIPLLRESLKEEQSMADFIESQIVPTTVRYLQLSGTSTRASV